MNKPESSGRTISIGRAPDNIFPLFNSTVLPYHADLSIGEKMIWLQDRSQGAKTKLLLGTEWVHFHRGPVNVNDKVQFGKTEPLVISEILKASAVVAPATHVERSCSVCKGKDAGEVIRKCGKCQGVYLAEAFLIRNLTQSEVVETEREGIELERPERVVTQKLVRCLNCAFVFSASEVECPDCHFKRVVRGS